MISIKYENKQTNGGKNKKKVNNRRFYISLYFHPVFGLPVKK